MTVQADFGTEIGVDFWHTCKIERLGIPSLRMSDGPNGVRGTRFFNGVPAACFPCGTALASTWDAGLIRSGGRLMGDEAIAKGAHILLGPTVNMQRSPLGGRGFESFSEDPVLAGTMAAATVKGIQDKGVAATIKHFVCNDQEHERQAYSAEISERALREIYLLPFQIAQRDARPWAYMAAYNRVNGTHVSENRRILQDILRSEWGFDGLVMSDWFGTYSTAEAINAGLDLEMPGPTNWRGKLVSMSCTSRKVTQHTIDSRVHALLKLIDKTNPLGIPENEPEKTIDTKDTSQLLRKIGSSSIVLLKNEGGVLPLQKNKKTAVIGPNAKFAAISGGGSASLLPYYAVTPFDGISAVAEHVEYALGAVAYKKLPLLGPLVKTPDGSNGFLIKFFLEAPEQGHRNPIDEVAVRDSNIFLMDYKHSAISGILYYADIEGSFTPEEDGDYLFSLSVWGTAKMYIDGKKVIDNATNQTPGDSFFSEGTREETASLRMEKSKTYKILVQFGTAPTSRMKTVGAAQGAAGGVRIGGTRQTDPQMELERAVQLARDVDQVVICAGLNAEWESEGYDRTTMDLPDHIDTLISAVANVNPNTVVVNQSGTPVTMPWTSEVPAIVQAWYGGNETGNAIADVLFGKVNPSGKLSLSWPLRLQDNPAFLNYRSERGRTVYGEGVFIGYRYYEREDKPVLFPFGHGLSYTTFSMGRLDLEFTELDEISVIVEVKNTGPVAGAEIVQVYIAQRSPSVARPKKELKGFEKVHLNEGESKIVQLKMPTKYACSFWDEERNMWIVEADTYNVLVGNSSASTPVEASFKIQKTNWWDGL